MEEARDDLGDFSPAISTIGKPSSKYSGEGVRGVAGPYEEMEFRPSIEESLSLNKSLMNFALELKLSKLSASDTSSLSSTTIVLMSISCFLVCQPRVGCFLESSISDVPSIDVALDMGRIECPL